MSPIDFLGTTWTELSARLDADQTLTRWGRAEPALAELASAADIAAIVHRGRNLDRTDAIFAALLRTAAADAGDDLDAGLLVAHLLANGTRTLAVALRDLSPDIDALIIGALWVQIRGFRWQYRRRGFAKGLLLDTRAAVLSELCPQRTDSGSRRVALVSPTLAAWIADDHFLDEGTPPPGAERAPLDAEQELAHVLAWAVHTGVVPAADVDLLVRLEFADVDHRRAVARTRGVHERTLRRECNRIKAALHEARWAYLQNAA